MELIYSDKKTEKACTSMKEARKLFGGNNDMAVGLHSRINALQQAETIKEIIDRKPFHFHKLKNNGKRNLEGCFAIDVKSRKEAWRIILEPLDENKEPYNPCNIDVIASVVRIVEIKEVSKHYE